VKLCLCISRGLSTGSCAVWLMPSVRATPLRRSILMRSVNPHHSCKTCLSGRFWQFRMSPHRLTARFQIHTQVPNSISNDTGSIVWAQLQERATAVVSEVAY
jgi:hypothetical protein